MINESVLFEVKNQVAIITMNEPKSMNALSGGILSGLMEAVQKIKFNTDIRAVILTGSGRAFCAGGDITSFPGISSAASGRRAMQQTAAFVKDLSQLEKPVIAAVNGHAIGAGFSLAITCDFIISSENAKFALGFTKIGVVPDLGALYHLPRIVGMARAKEMAYSARTLSAEEAKEYGICLEIVPADELLTRAQEIAESFTQGPAYSIGLTKAVLNRSYESTLEEILREEEYAQAIAFSTDDFKEGVRAFLEKRKPSFTGK